MTEKPYYNRNPKRSLLITPAKEHDGAVNVRIRSNRRDKSKTLHPIIHLLSYSDKELILLLHNHFGHKGYKMHQVEDLMRIETGLLLTLYHDELCFSNQQKADIKKIAYILKFGKSPSRKVLQDIYGEAQKDKTFITT